MRTPFLAVVFLFQAAVAVAAPTTTTLVNSSSTVTIGDVTTLSATVTPAPGSGTVTFRDGTTSLGTAPVVAGTATLTRILPLSGARSLSASFGGNAGFTASTSAPIVVTVAQVPGSWGLVAWLNSTFTLTTAQVVRFGAGASWVQRWSLAGATSCSTTTFGGDPAPGLTKRCEVLAGTPTSVSLTTSVIPVAVSAATVLRAVITPSTATGTVSFYEGATLLATVTVTGGLATSSRAFTTAGPRSVTAVYNGTATFSSSTATLLLTVTPRLTATAVRSSVNPSAVGASTVLSATVTGTNVTGTITFRDGAASLGAVPLVNGVATRVQVLSGAGPHPLTAVYSGDANNVGSTSPSLVQTVVSPGSPPTPPASVSVVRQLEYDADLRLAKATVAPGVTSFGLSERQTFDAFGRTATVVDAKGATTTLQYSAAHGLVSVRDPRNLTTLYSTSGLNHVRQVTSPDTGTVTSTRDANGNELSRTDARGVVTTMAYDALDRKTSASATLGAQTQVVQWRYDEATSAFGRGQLTSTTFPGGSQQFQFDAHGRVASEVLRVEPTAGSNTALITKTVGYSHDGTGALASMTYPSGSVVRFTNVNGRLASLSLSPTATGAQVSLLSGVRFATDGRVDGWQWTMATGAEAHDVRRDTMGRPVQYRLGKVLRQLSYDPAGRITGYTHFDAITGAAVTSLNQQFGYDETGRLTVMLTSGATYGVSYDATGNRTQFTTNLAANVYTNASDSNRLVSTSAPVRALTYDQTGNVLNDSAAGTTLTYDALGRLATAKKGTTTATYTYDASGRRVRKFTSAGASSTVLFVYDRSDHLVGEYSNTGAPLREYVWVQDTPVAMFVPNGAAAPTVYFIHADHLDAPRALVDVNGALRWTWFSEPFGSTAPNTNPAGLGAVVFNLRFPGQYADAETGLFYNWARFYDPMLGRYTQSDPIGLEGGLNTFTYANGNPVSYADPEGHVAIALIPAAPAIGAGLTNAAGMVISAAGAALAAGAILRETGVGPRDIDRLNDRSAEEMEKDKSVPIPRKPNSRNMWHCVARANRDGRSTKNCTEKPFAFGWGAAPNKHDAKNQAERMAKEKLGAASTHHVQVRCIDSKGVPWNP